MKIIYLTVCINEQPILSYYLNPKNFEPIAINIPKEIKTHQVIANYNLKIIKGPCLHKIKFKTFDYYEINFEQAYKQLYLIPKNEYTKLERYLIKLIKLVTTDKPNDLINFLSKTKKYNKKSLLEIIKIFKQYKHKHLF